MKKEVSPATAAIVVLIVLGTVSAFAYKSFQPRANSRSNAANGESARHMADSIKAMQGHPGAYRGSEGPPPGTTGGVGQMPGAYPGMTGGPGTGR